MSQAISRNARQTAIPRGWVVVGLALSCWAMVIVAGFGLVKLFSLVSGVVFG